MMIYENIRLAFSSLMANKMRALLTMLGIIIGIASVIAIMTVGNSITSQMNNSMAEMGANNITVTFAQKTQEEEHRENGVNFGSDSLSDPSIKEEDLITRDMIAEYAEKYGDSIMAISCSRDVGNGRVEEGNLYANVSMLGVPTGYFIANKTDIAAGRFFSKRELDEARNVAFVSDKLVNNMFKGDNDAAVGKQIQVYIGEKMYKLTIVGVYEFKESAMSFSMSSEKDRSTNLYIPLKTAQNIFHKYEFSNLTVVAAPGVDAEAFADTTENFFNGYYRGNRYWQISAFTMASLLDSLNGLMGTLTTAISVIAGIALLVGGIGVMNIMLVSITERTREIGTRKALGAPNSSIRTQFIVEAIVICIVGGIIGIVIGVFAGIRLAIYLGTPAVPSIQSIIMSLSFSMAIGVFFGYYPANKAAQMDPIEALRYE